MLEFVTLFLALTSGPQAVALAVEEPVTRVELRLDGRRVGELDGSPWGTEVDFGPLAPHRLEAVGYGAEGRELDRATQMINLPRPRAESRLVLERDADGRVRHARLVWDSVEKRTPQRVEVRFDGRPVPVDQPRTAIPLPEHDLQRQHYLVAELVFEGGLRTETAVGFGGRYGAEVTSDLTAVAVRRLGEAEALPSLEAMTGWFLHDGEPVTVRAVEEAGVDGGGADLFVTRHELAFRTVRRAVRPRGRTAKPELRGQADLLRDPDRGFLVHPVPDQEASRSARKSLFPISPALHHGGRGGLTWLVAEVSFRGTERGEERLAEAVAVAGLTAAKGRPRAVVALAHPDSSDHSQISWNQARRYLATLRVPLHVWSPVHPERFRQEWGDVESVRFPLQLQQAVRDLRKGVDSQSVVWLEGSFLPREIELSAEARRHVEWAR